MPDVPLRYRQEYSKEYKNASKIYGGKKVTIKATITNVLF